MNKSPLLSVCIRSYNQANFIKEALDSVLVQKTTFPFEIIVSDDCSTDGTVEILKKYATRYPRQIRLVLGKCNVGGPNNLRRVIEASNAKYITCLDGDDYYIDENKLQKQVDFLESHHEYAACFHNTLNVNAKGEPLSLFNIQDFPPTHDAHDFILKRWFVPIHSAVIRREYIEFPKWYDSVMNDDYVIHLSVVRHAPYYYMPEVMVAYRHHEKEISMAYHDIELINNQLKTILKGMSELYPNEYKSDFEKRILMLDKEIRQERLLAHSIKKWFFYKTYSRAIKKLLRRIAR